MSRSLLFNPKKFRAIAIFALALSPALPTLAPSAFAQSEESRIVQVQTGDLNLTTPEGKAVLHRRLDLAARQVCGLPAGLPVSAEEAPDCYNPTLADARFTAHRMIIAANNGQAAPVATASR